MLATGSGTAVAQGRKGTAATPNIALDAGHTNSLDLPICITGMGRCGTSLTTAIIGLLGRDLGPGHGMLPANRDDNARGYWEQREIYEINEEILKTFGGTWGHPPDLPPDWERSRALDTLRARAGNSLASLFGAHKHRWAWKDPRASLTLPFWQDLIGNMDYVLCVRTPSDVAASVVRRGTDEVDFDAAVALWILYVRAALRNTRGHRRLVLRFEDYFTNANRQIQRLTEFVRGPGTELDAETYDRITSFIEPHLWRNRGPAPRADRDQAILREATDLYVDLPNRNSP